MELFERGNEERLNISAYIISPKSMNDIDNIAYYDNYAQRRIKEAEAMIASLQTYRLMLCSRAQEIAAAPWHLELELRREYHYYRKAVTYHIILYRKNNSGDILLPPLYQIYLLFYSSATISTKALICCFVIFSYLIFYKNTLSNTISYFYFIWCLTEI